MLDTFTRVFDCYKEDRGLVPKGQLAEISYESMVDDPKSALRRLYRELALGDFSRAEPKVDAYLAQIGDYKTNEYTLSEAQRRRVLEHWAPYIEHFGYGEGTGLTATNPAATSSSRSGLRRDRAST